jgi:hypothetical protein
MVDLVLQQLGQDTLDGQGLLGPLFEPASEKERCSDLMK